MKFTFAKVFLVKFCNIYSKFRILIFAGNSCFYVFLMIKLSLTLY